MRSDVTFVAQAVGGLTSFPECRLGFRALGTIRHGAPTVPCSGFRGAAMRGVMIGALHGAARTQQVWRAGECAPPMFEMRLRLAYQSGTMSRLQEWRDGRSAPHGERVSCDAGPFGNGVRWERRPALVAAAQRDRAGFAPLYERYHRAMYVYCYRRLLNPEAAEDAAATVFVKAIVALPKFRPDPRRSGSTFRSWLFSIAHNVVVDAWRQQRPDLSLDPGGRCRIGGFRGSRSPARRISRSGTRKRACRPPSRPPARPAARERGTPVGRADDAPRSQTALGMSSGATKAMQFRAYRRLRDLLAANPHAITREVPK